MARSGHPPASGDSLARTPVRPATLCVTLVTQAVRPVSPAAPRERCTMRLIIGIVVVAWLVVGAVAAAQRGYFGNDRAVGCKFGADAGLTVLAGPLNYPGVNPKVTARRRSPPTEPSDRVLATHPGDHWGPQLVWTTGPSMTSPGRAHDGGAGAGAVRGGPRGQSWGSDEGRHRRRARRLVVAAFAASSATTSATAGSCDAGHGRGDHRRRAAQLPGARPQGPCPEPSA